ncbi:MlaD family protein [Nocardia sp. NBC_01503]|uniref:MlaD family protein n=1 Tax=Nocardia sp. NBC_01503 TaxID=2975997 RepID=UPI002E7AE10F|nr:MlaD family protein [Nocardia sp. NBC_01503]WTL30161.1 MlaD family protein [Nocardia sp. NBC_01503]
MTTWRRTRAYAITCLTALFAVSGCDMQPGDIPVPGAGVSGPTYTLRIEFANVLNLPQGAKVIADGVRVGQLTHVTLVDPSPANGDQPARAGYAIADIAVRTSMRLPLGTTAELRQDTPLGDVHIALAGPANSGAGQLQPGATIPLANTTRSPSIEDVLAGLSTFIGSGAIADFQDIVRKANGVMPRDPADTARIAGVLGADLTDLGEHLASADTLLDGIQATVNEGLIKNEPMLDGLLTPYGVQHTTDAVNAEIGVIFVLTALGPLGPAAAWLGPLVGSLDGAARAVVPMLFGSHPLDSDSPSNMKLLTDLIQNKLIPFAERGPKVNLVGVQVAGLSATDRTDRIVETLRMIGAVR